jgi:hypothetical protein
MANKLLEDLTNLKNEEKALRRCLDISYYDNEKRTELFKKLKECKINIEKVKFKIRMERKLNVKDNNTYESDN